MYIDTVPNRNSPPAVLLRESFRQHGKVKKRTIANLSKCPDHVVDGLRILLKGGIALRSPTNCSPSCAATPTATSAPSSVPSTNSASIPSSLVPPPASAISSSP